MQTRQRFQNAAASSNSEVVHAYDSDGNEVAIGLVMEGPFDTNHSAVTENSQYVQTNENFNVIVEHEMNWIAAEEECTSSKLEVEENGNIQELEAFEPKETVVKKEKTSVIKVYKRKGAQNKTLKTLKMKLEEARRKLKEKEGKKSRRSRSTRGGQCSDIQNIPRVKKEKKKDLSYSPSVSVRKLQIKSK